MVSVGGDVGGQSSGVVVGGEVVEAFDAAEDVRADGDVVVVVGEGVVGDGDCAAGADADGGLEFGVAVEGEAGWQVGEFGVGDAPVGRRGLAGVDAEELVQCVAFASGASDGGGGALGSGLFGEGAGDAWSQVDVAVGAWVEDGPGSGVVVAEGVVGDGVAVVVGAGPGQVEG